MSKGKRFYRKFIDEPAMSDKTLLVSVEDLIAAAFGPLESLFLRAIMSRRFDKVFDEPNMSDKTLLVSVEDLIWMAFGPAAKNTVNFKLIQTILHILARQLRLLEQDVEIKFDEIGIDFETGRSYRDVDEYDDNGYYDEDDYDSSSYSSSSSGDEEVEGRGARKERGKVGGKKERGEQEEKGEKEERGEKGKKKERHEKGEKGEREEKGEKKEKKGKHEKGEKDKRHRSKDKKRGSKDRGTSSSPRGRRSKDEGAEQEGRGGRHDGRRRRGEDDDEKGGERDGHGRRHGGRHGRGENDEDEGGERDGHGRRHGERRRRGEDDGDEGDEREGRRHGGRNRDREERERRGDRHGERRHDRHGERRGDRRGERGGEYDDYDDRGRRRWGGREGSGTSITVTEASRKGGSGATDKVLVAERGPATHGRIARVGSIEVVTASQFAMLARAVRQLEHVSGPLPMPALPDNEQLRADLAKGRASLSDTMEAVQLNARVQAAEEGLSRMAGLLTQLTAAGALPSDFASRIGNLQAELRKSTLTTGQEGQGRRGFTFSAGPGSRGASTGFAEDAGLDEAGAGTGADQAGGPGLKTSEKTSGVRSTAGVAGAAEPAPPNYEDLPVTHNEMQNILDQMKEALTKEIQNLTARANHSADIASNTSRNVSEKLNIALSIDERITTLYSQTADYAEQLNGFDTGLSTQMASFQEQMMMMRTDLKGGLEMLESANNNAETAAILDLTERYESLVIELDNTVHLHSNLSLVQQQIRAELKSLVECVEMLREQKADRDEVLDGLRDKADISRLAGLLYEKDFAQARFEIEKRIEKSYDKFNKQDEEWQIAMRDLTRITDHKAELIALMALKDKATHQLNSIQEKLRQLEIMLGEPQAALLMRRLAAGAACGACLTPAVMPLEDAAHGQPALLPALRPAPLGAEDLCFGEIVLRPPDPRNHICHRWVGGSHTLVAGNILRERAAQSHLEAVPTKKYEGYGTDGRLYMMEEELQPCGECNKFSTDDARTPPLSPTPTGAGDHGQPLARTTPRL